MDRSSGEGHTHHKKRRRFSRSRGGCLTCKQRKVKCDEERPGCSRCRSDSRDCQGYVNAAAAASSSSSSPKPPRSSKNVVGLPPPVSSSSESAATTATTTAATATTATTATTTHSHIDLDNLLDTQVSPSTHFPDDAFANSTGDTTQLDDWLYLIYNSSATVDLSSGLAHWPNLSTETSAPLVSDHHHAHSHTNSNGFLHSSSSSSPLMATSTSSGESAGGVMALATAAAALATSSASDTATSSTTTNSTVATQPSSRRTIDVELDVARVLNGQLRSLCTSALQFDAICRFFDFVAQCFHLLPSSQNLWRKVFGQLCTESPLILKLTTGVGLVSLTHCGTIHKRPLAYALLAQSLAKWKQILAKATRAMTTSTSPGKEEEQREEEGKAGNREDPCYVFSELTILEVLAGAILIGHFEQFDTGLGSSTPQCMADVNKVINAVVTGRVAGSIDTEKGSQFRFLVKIYLWWDTLSATLSVTDEGNDNRAIFDAVHRWEVEEDDVLQSCQCITGWPLSLLETVSKVREYSSKQQQHQRGGQSSSPDSDSESLLREGDIDLLEAEILACRPRVVPGDSLRVAELRYVIFEMLATGVLIYCHRLVHGHCDNVQREVKRIVHFLGKRESDRILPGAHHGSEGLAWIDRAPDGTLVWAYFQAAMTVSDRKMQEQCEGSMNAWIAFADCAAVNVEMFMLRAVWAKLEQGKETNLNTIYEQVCRERRWTHPLIL